MAGGRGVLCAGVPLVLKKNKKKKVNFFFLFNFFFFSFTHPKGTVGSKLASLTSYFGLESFLVRLLCATYEL